MVIHYRTFKIDSEKFGARPSAALAKKIENSLYENPEILRMKISFNDNSIYCDKDHTPDALDIMENKKPNAERIRVSLITAKNLGKAFYKKIFGSDWEDIIKGDYAMNRS